MSIFFTNIYDQIVYFLFNIKFQLIFYSETKTHKTLYLNTLKLKTNKQTLSTLEKLRVKKISLFFIKLK